VRATAEFAAPRRVWGTSPSEGLVASCSRLARTAPSERQWDWCPGSAVSRAETTNGVSAKHNPVGRVGHNTDARSAPFERLASRRARNDGSTKGGDASGRARAPRTSAASGGALRGAYFGQALRPRGRSARERESLPQAPGRIAPRHAGRRPCDREKHGRRSIARSIPRRARQHDLARPAGLGAPKAPLVKHGERATKPDFSTRRRSVPYAVDGPRVGVTRRPRPAHLLPRRTRSATPAPSSIEGGRPGARRSAAGPSRGTKAGPRTFPACPLRCSQRPDFDVRRCKSRVPMR